MCIFTVHQLSQYLPRAVLSLLALHCQLWFCLIAWVWIAEGTRVLLFACFVSHKGQGESFYFQYLTNCWVPIQIVQRSQICNYKLCCCVLWTRHNCHTCESEVFLDMAHQVTRSLLFQGIPFFSKASLIVIEELLLADADGISQRGGDPVKEAGDRMNKRFILLVNYLCGVVQHMSRA